jgi:hypothetical protein
MGLLRASDHLSRAASTPRQRHYEELIANRLFPAPENSRTL